MRYAAVGDHGTPYSAVGHDMPHATVAGPCLTAAGRSYSVISNTISGKHVGFAILHMVINITERS